MLDLLKEEEVFEVLEKLVSFDKLLFYVVAFGVFYDEFCYDWV